MEAIVDAVRKGFYFFWPPIPKKAWTPEGESMRSTALWLSFFHFVFFTFMLIQVGLMPTIM